MEPCITQIGLDRWHTPLPVLEALHATRTRPPELPGPPVTQGWITLGTCHRLELYLEGPIRRPEELFWDWLPAEAKLRKVVESGLTVRRGEEAARHLIRTAAGLESVLLGEDQILSQTRLAYRVACERRSSGPLLHRLFHTSFRAGRRVRGETDLNCGSRSLAGEAVALLHRELGGLRDRAVLVAGTGSMGELSCQRLRERGVGRLFIASRSWARACEVARAVRGEPLAWSERSRVLQKTDGAIAASGAAEPVITARDLTGALEHRRRLTVVDLGVPRNVTAPDPLPEGLRLVDLEGLSHLLMQTRERRSAAILAADRIVEEELAAWLEWCRSRPQPGATLAPGRESS